MLVDTMRSRPNTNPCKEDNICLTQESHHFNNLIVNVMSMTPVSENKIRIVIDTREETLTTLDKNMVSTLLLGFWACSLHGNGSQD